MRFIRGLFGGVLLLTAPVMVWAGLSVDTGSSKDTDFFKYKTYAWKEGTIAMHTTVQQIIERSVEEELDTSGLKKVDIKPDVYVITHVALQGSLEFGAVGYAGPSWRGWDRWGTWNDVTGIMNPVVSVGEVATGTLLVDLLDGESGDLVWRGVARGKVPDNPDSAGKKARKAIQKMFKKFPPKPKR